MQPLSLDYIKGQLDTILTPIVQETLTDFPLMSGGLYSKTLNHFVVEAADIVSNVWVDILGQACTEADNGRIVLDKETMLPDDSSLYLLIAEAVLSTVITEKDFKYALSRLQRNLFSGRTSVELPLNIGLRFVEDSLVVERKFKNV